MTQQTNLDALTRAVETVRKDPAEAKRIDERIAKGESWFDVATSAAFDCQMVALGLKPWETPPMFANVTEPLRDELAIALLKRLLDAGLSRYEPDPVAALERAEAEATKGFGG